MNTNFEPITKRSLKETEQDSNWQQRKERAKKLHKTKRGNSEKRNWNEVI